MEIISKVVQAVWDVASNLPAWSYISIVACLAVQLISLFLGVNAYRHQVALKEASQLALKWESLPLHDPENEANRTIAPYRLIVRWLTDALLVEDPKVAGQKTARHRLFLGKLAAL